MDFKNAQELLTLCDENKRKVSAVMLRRECDETGCSEESAVKSMKKALEIMRDSVEKPIEHPRKSMGGLIGGEAEKYILRLFLKPVIHITLPTYG